VTAARVCPPELERGHQPARFLRQDANTTVARRPFAEQGRSHVAGTVVDGEHLEVVEGLRVE
jgi:hypothetical protein